MATLKPNLDLVEPTIRPLLPTTDIILTPMTQTVGYEAGQGTFKITANNISGITVTSTDIETVTVQLVKDELGYECVYDYKQNNTNQTRTVSINVSGKDLNGFTYSETFTLVQLAEIETPIEITTSFGDTLNLTAYAQTGTFKIEGNGEHTADITVNVDWFTCVYDEATDEWIYKVTKNPSILDRKTVMYVTVNGITFTFNIVQSSSTTMDSVILQETEHICSWQSNIFYIPFIVSIHSQSFLEIVTDSDWLEIDTNSLGLGFPKSPIRVTVDENPDNKQRTGLITFKLSGGIAATYSVVQRAQGLEPVLSTVHIEDVRVNFEAQTVRLDVNSLNIQYYTDLTDDDDSSVDNWMYDKTMMYTPEGEVFVFSVTMNVSTKSRSGKLWIHYVDYNGEKQKAEVSIVQDGYVSRNYFPIWKSTDIELEGETGHETEYIITANDSTIHKAKVYFDNTNKYRLNLNEILRYYMTSVLEPNDMDYIQNTGGMLSGVVAVWDGETYNTVSEYITWNDTSYVENEHGYRLITNEPISNYYDSRQLIPVSFMNVQGQTDLLVVRKISYRPLKQSKRYDASTSMQTCLLEPVNNERFNVTATYADRQEVSTYYLQECTGARYCIYYQNAYGGYDYLLVKGKTVTTDNYSRTTFTRDRNNTKPVHAEKVTKVDVSTVYEVYTDFLTQEQSNLMHHLFGSTAVWIHDLKTNVIVPVNVQDSSVQKKTKERQTRIFYKITLKEADTKTRL